MYTKYLVFLLGSISAVVIGYNIDLAIKYFTVKQINILCLITCGERAEIKDFAKQAGFALILTRAADYSNINNILSCLEVTNSAIGVLLDMNCENATDVLEFASEEKLFDDMHKWLIFEKEKCNDSFVVEDYLQVFNETMKQLILNYEDVLFDAQKINTSLLSLQCLISLNLGIDTDVTVAIPKDSLTYELYEVYNFGKIQGGTLKITSRGNWSQDKGLTFKTFGYKYYERWNFEQMKLRIICVMLEPPKEFYPELLTGRQITIGVAAFTKLSTMVLNVIREVHNISFVYTVTDRWIGLPFKNSTRFASNSLQFGEQDITPCIRMSSLLAPLDMIGPPTSAIESRFFYRIPSKGIGKFENQFGRPFSTGSWLCSFVVLIICGVLLVASAKSEHRPSSGQYAIFTIIASISQQHFDDNVVDKIGFGSTARKLTCFVTGVLCLLLYNYYTSSVVSWLLNGPAPSIHSLEDLIDSPLKLLFEDVGYTRSWLQTPGYYYNSKNAYYEDKLRQTKIHVNKISPFKGVEEGIALVRSGGHAYHTEPYNANIWISRTFTPQDLCQLGTLQVMEKTPLYTALQHRSPYKEFFTWSTMRAYERGHVKCMQRRVEMHIPGCEGSSPRALALGGAAPAFSIFVLGFFLATIIVVVERVRFRLMNNKNLENFQVPYME